MKIIYSYYVLDIVHRGHLLYMKNAKGAVGKDGISIVGILTDEAVMEKKQRPILSLDERIELAHSIEFVDVVVPQMVYSPIDNILLIKPNIVMESISHSMKLRENVLKACEEIGARLITIPYYPDYSSTQIKKRMTNEKRKSL